MKIIVQSPGIQNNIYHLFLVSTLYRTHHKYHTILLYLRHIMFRLSIITPYRIYGANNETKKYMLRPIHHFHQFFPYKILYQSHPYKLLQSYQINLPFLRTLSKKLHFSAYTRCYHIFTIITNAFHTTCSYLPFYNTFLLYYTAPTVHCQSYKNNYFNIRHVLNEQLNHSLEFSAPMSFKFVTTINIALPRYKVTSSRFSQ